jgi:hypothetical protein
MPDPSSSRIASWVPRLVLLALCASAATSLPGQVPSVQPGFPNVAQTPGDLLSGLNAPNQGRTAILA